MKREAIESAGSSQSEPDLFRGALERLPDAVVICDSTGCLRFVNDAALDLFGPQATAGADLSDALRVCPSLAELVRQATRSGTPQSGCETPKSRAGIGRLLARAVPLPVGGGCLLTARPVSDGAHEDRDLWQAEKMAALGRLAASVAHEVRNPLGSVDIQLQLLAEEARTLDGPIATSMLERVDRARSEMRSLDGIVNNFLRFSRPPAVRLEATDPVPLVQRMVDLVAPEARSRRIELHFQESPHLPHVLDDENALSQALLNVVINAFQAVASDSDESRVDIECRWDASRERVLIEVRDNGCGIPADDLERVLEFYYTTKDTGTGLGLSIAQGILQQHGGSLQLTSRVGLGTSVTLALPACARPKPRSSEPTRPA
jgi:signal transduction histidine kinase